MIGIAQTGSGKTLGFLIPGIVLLSKILYKPHAFAVPSPKMLIMSPTRELAMQSFQVLQEMDGAPGSVCIYGGVDKKQQINDLKSKGEIVIATPGRLLDLIEEGKLTLSQVFYCVLDEADRMLDEGFEPAIRKIIGNCPSSSTPSGFTKSG